MGRSFSMVRPLLWTWWKQQQRHWLWCHAAGQQWDVDRLISQLTGALLGYLECCLVLLLPMVTALVLVVLVGSFPWHQQHQQKYQQQIQSYCPPASPASLDLLLML